MIEIKGMAFGYKRQRLFDGLDLSLEPGNIYGLLGKNGAQRSAQTATPSHPVCK